MQITDNLATFIIFCNRANEFFIYSEITAVDHWGIRQPCNCIGGHQGWVIAGKGKMSSIGGLPILSGADPNYIHVYGVPEFTGLFWMQNTYLPTWSESCC